MYQTDESETIPRHDASPRSVEVHHSFRPGDEPMGVERHPYAIDGVKVTRCGTVAIAPGHTVDVRGPATGWRPGDGSVP